MNQFPKVLSNRMSDLDLDSRRRSLVLRKGIDFSSNDYLGFSEDPLLKEIAFETMTKSHLGSSASRLLRGHLEVFEETEQILAEFCSRDSALLYPSGYQANVGLLSGLLRPGDTVFSDLYNHASIIDGLRLSGARRLIYPHTDCLALRKLLMDDLARRSDGDSNGNEGIQVIVTESLFGMDGDIAPLKELADLAEEFSALLVVDEAHATGIWGRFEQNRGGGLVQYHKLSSRVFATIHPGGKAMGIGGAWVCGDRLFKDYLINFSRAQIFSTALSPVVAELLKSSVLFWKEVGKTRANRLLESSNYFRKSLREVLKETEIIPQVEGPITPVILGENLRAIEKAEVLQKAGFDVRAIRPPTVPKGQARLRLTHRWNLSDDEISRFVSCFR